MSAMRILFTRFPLESRFGGAEVQTLALMKGLQEKGHTISFLGSCPVLLEETKKLKIENGKLKIDDPPVTKWNALCFLWRQFAIKRKLYSQFSIFNFQFHADVVCMLSLSEKLLLTPYLHKQGVKVIWIEHDRVGPWLTKNPWIGKLRKLSRLATTVVVSNLSKNIYEKLGFQNVIAIPNGIDTTRLQRSNLTTHDARRTMDFRIGTIARLSKEKGVDVLLEALKDLPDVSLTIVGTGPEELTLHADCLALTSCHMHPEEKNLGDFYGNLDLFVLPSRDHDPFGLVAGEAMMMGVPVIVTDACGIASYLQSGWDAVVVPANIAEELRNAIVDLLQDVDKRERMGREGKSTAEELFSLQSMIEAYEQTLMQK